MEFTTRSGLAVVIDDDQADLADLGGWYMHSSGYIAREVRTVDFLHHMVLGTEPRRGMRVDHRNRNPLDNRRENLRFIPAQGNSQNRPRITRRGTYRGVTWSRARQKWVARATLNYQTHHLGYFDDPEEAAEVVSLWRAEHMEFSDADRG